MKSPVSSGRERAYLRNLRPTLLRICARFVPHLWLKQNSQRLRGLRGCISSEFFLLTYPNIDLILHTIFGGIWGTCGRVDVWSYRRMGDGANGRMGELPTSGRRGDGANGRVELATHGRWGEWA